MKRPKIFIVLVLGIVLVLFYAGKLLVSENFGETNVDDFIVVNPLDLSKIKEFSAFRSCMGHDYSGNNTLGEKETIRSMKHYVTQKESGPLEVIAPFDGRITSISPSGAGAQIWIQPDANPAWIFIFFHIDSIVEKGDKVKAGQLVGTTVVGEAMNFDIGLKKFDGLKGPSIFDSPFLHMNEEVLAEYKAVGITPENMVVSKAVRDADPCPTIPNSGPEPIFPGDDDGVGNSVLLQ